MDVLVYSGPGVSQTALTHVLDSFRTALTPNYTVNPITASQLASHPWPSSCALLIMPGGKDVPYVSTLQGTANERIQAYVRGGGKFLGIGAGAYFASKAVEWEVGTPNQVVGNRELGFYPGTCAGNVYPGFVLDREEGGQIVSVKLDLDEEGEGEKVYDGVYYNGGGHFKNAEDPSMALKGVRVVARYSGGEGEAKAAAVLCKYGTGRAMLWGVHIEYPLDKEPARSTFGRTERSTQKHLIEDLETGRWALMKRALGLLGLSVGNDGSTTSTTETQGVAPLPQMLASSRPSVVSAIMKSLEQELTQGEPRAIEDANDTFQFHPSTALHALVESSKQGATSTSLPKNVIVFENGIPQRGDTPLFSLEDYFRRLKSTRQDIGLEAAVDEKSWGIGEAMLYGEVVTSTQTLFDKNPTFMRALPTPILSLASQQLTGRGRGANVWLSPAGCLQFSILLRPPAQLKPSSMVFIQYLFGLAVVEACRSVIPGKGGDKVRLKWPNDIYAVLPGGERKKLGGILVNTNFSGGQIDVVIGCGINVLNPLPTTSLSHLQSPTDEALTLENVAGAIMPVFENMWLQFIESGGSFEPFRQLYLERWLHSDQLVTLTTTTPHTKVRIVGITPDYGLLRTVPVGDGWSGGGTNEYIDLQPDGNSFDMMEGLIKLKK